MRIIEQISMSTGERSMAQVGRLHSILQYAIITLGGTQQSTGPTATEESCKQHREEHKEGEADIRLIAEEIFLALTGEHIVKTRKGRDASV
jgi:hypothetical protein